MISVSTLMYTNVVLDTSVILKWFRQEEILADQALRLRQAYLAGQVTISVPTLLAYELANVLRYKRELTTEQVQQAVQSLFDMNLNWTVPTSLIMRRAVEVAHTHEATVYDAAFAALAESLQTGFITADARLVNRLQPLHYVHFLGDIVEES
jgi:predicted nucleic acid-binding protein